MPNEYSDLPVLFRWKNFRDDIVFLAEIIGHFIENVLSDFDAIKKYLEETEKHEVLAFIEEIKQVGESRKGDLARGLAIIKPVEYTYHFGTQNYLHEKFKLPYDGLTLPDSVAVNLLILISGKGRTKAQKKPEQFLSLLKELKKMASSSPGLLTNIQHREILEVEKIVLEKSNDLQVKVAADSSALAKECADNMFKLFEEMAREKYGISGIALFGDEQRFHAELEHIAIGIQDATLQATAREMASSTKFRTEFIAQARSALTQISSGIDKHNARQREIDSIISINAPQRIAFFCQSIDPRSSITNGFCFGSITNWGLESRPEDERLIALGDVADKSLVTFSEMHEFTVSQELLESQFEQTSQLGEHKVDDSLSLHEISNIKQLPSASLPKIIISELKKQADLYTRLGYDTPVFMITLSVHRKGILGIAKEQEKRGHAVGFRAYVVGNETIYHFMDINIGRFASKDINSFIDWLPKYLAKVYPFKYNSFTLSALYKKPDLGPKRFLEGLGNMQSSNLFVYAKEGAIQEQDRLKRQVFLKCIKMLVDNPMNLPQEEIVKKAKYHYETIKNKTIEDDTYFILVRIFVIMELELENKKQALLEVKETLSSLAQYAKQHDSNVFSKLRLLLLIESACFAYELEKIDEFNIHVDAVRDMCQRTDFSSNSSELKKIVRKLSLETNVSDIDLYKLIKNYVDSESMEDDFISASHIHVFIEHILKRSTFHQVDDQELVHQLQKQNATRKPNCSVM